MIGDTFAALSGAVGDAELSLSRRRATSHAAANAVGTGGTARTGMGLSRRQLAVASDAADLSEAEQEAADAQFNMSSGWIPVIGTVYNAASLTTDFLQFAGAVGRGDIPDIFDEIADMATDIVGMVPIVGGPLAATIYHIREALSAPPNKAPSALDDSFTTNENTPVTGNILANDTDAEGDTFTAAIGSQGTYGSATVEADGTFTYVPAVNYAGADTFTYTVTDGVNTSTGKVSITVSLDTTVLQQLAATGAALVSENSDGTVRAIDGTFSGQLVHNATDAAGVFNALAAVLGAPPGFATADAITSQQVSGADATSTGVYYRLRPSINGVPVAGSTVILVANGNGTVTSIFNGLSQQVSSADTTPLIDSTAATTVATAAIIATASTQANGTIDPQLLAQFQASLTSDSHLVIYDLDSGAPPQLAWQVDISTTPPSDGPSTAPAPARIGTYYIAANGTEPGAILSENLDASQAASQQTAYGYTFTAESQNGVLVLRDGARNIEVYQNVSSGSFLFWHWGEKYELANNRSGWNRDAVAAYANIEGVFNYYHDVLKRTSYDGRGGQILVGVNAPITDDAQWQPSSHQIMFGSGDLEEALDVVGHEFTHGVIQFVVGNGASVWKSGESGALGEAYGDILGSLIEGKTRDDAGRWLVAEDASGDPFRNMADPSEFKWRSTNISFSEFYGSRYRGSSDDGGEHINSTIFSHAFYRMVMDPGNDPNDTGFGGVLSRGQGRTANITDDQWAKVFYNSLYRLPANATFVDARSAVISAAKAQAFSQTEIEAIQDAFDHVGIKASNYKYGAYDTVDLGGTPSDLAASANGNRTYVIVGNTVKVVDTQNASTTTPESVTVGGSPISIAVNNNGTRAYVTNSSSGTVTVIQKLLGVGAKAETTTVAVGGQPNGVAVNAAGTRAYVANSGSGTVSIIDYDFSGYGTPTVTTVAVGAGPYKVAANSDGTRAFVTNTASGSVSIIDYAGGTPVVNTYTVGANPREVAVSNDGTRALVYGTNGSVYVVDANAGSPVTVTKVPGQDMYSYTSDGFIAMSGDGHWGYVTDHDGDVEIINTAYDASVPLGVYVAHINDLNHSVATSTDGSKAFVVTHNHLYILSPYGGIPIAANIPFAINNNASNYQQVSVSANGQFVVATDINGKMTILNATAF
ncbi:M4 family metallopeptidase [Mycobacterium sp. EPa45]|uniref:M4 family metallopeptidase n=1 Tax=Mycobacterium sp. EPa45 TaxID=1545728 RepID=UPI0011874EF7|nr:M4 family metallopeptidase [Mycobacterium sp. EPa45]